MKIREMFKFGPFLVDPQSRALMREGNPVALNRRAFDVLLYLVQNPGRAVTKEEILKSVWPDSYVDENNLMQSISALRKALEERPGANSFIATLAGRGYQFIAPVSRVDEPEAASQSSRQTAVEGANFVLQLSMVTTRVVTEERRPRLAGGWLLGCVAVSAVLLCIGA